MKNLILRNYVNFSAAKKKENGDQETAIVAIYHFNL